jgi:tape measure domain-containing protein
MQFRNDQFEQGVKKSLISLENLKKGLNLDKSSKSLSNLESTAKNFSMKNLASDVASISDRFSTMGIIGMTALQNITNSAIATGKTLMSALTIDPVKSGFQEYETQINSVQTILANTESKGTTLDQVNAALDELNHYADMTIYNFTEMTRNIGTFTAAGVDLDTSVQAIKGIANLAAVSGSNSQQASTAMYQLSQALAAGTVKLQDWNSVVNAGMGGQVFQDALKETARVHGVAIDQMIKDEGSFRETLSKGWLTSSILTETLSKFTGDLNESQLKTMGYTDEQISSIIKMGQTANDAATKVKTFTQLFDTLKEAMQSGWTQSWEYIVGNFDQAKESLTVVSDTLSDIINNSSNKRNDLLYDALTSNYDKFIKSINDAGIETTAFQDRVKAAINENGGDADALIQKYGTLEKAIRAGAVSSDLLKKSLGGISKESLNIDRLLHFKDTGEDVKNVQEALKQLGYDLSKYGSDGLIGSETTAAIKAFQQAKGLSVDGIVGPNTVKALQDAVGSTDKLKKNVDDLMNDITKKGGRDLAIESIGYAWKGLIRIAHDVKDAYKDIFPKEFTSDDLYGIIQKVHDLSFNLMYSSKTSDQLQRSFKGLFAALDIVGTITGGAVRFGFRTLCDLLKMSDIDILEFTANLGDNIVKLRDAIHNNTLYTSALEFTSTNLKKAASFIKDWTVKLYESEKVQNGIKKVQEEWGKGLNKLGGYFEGGSTRLTAFINRCKKLDKIDMNNIGDVLKDFKDNVFDYFVNTDKIFDTAGKGIDKFKDYAHKGLSIVVGDFNTFGEGLDKLKDKSWDTVITNLSKLKDGISEFADIVKDKLSNVDWSPIVAIVGSGLIILAAKQVSKLINSIKRLTSLLPDFSNLGDSVDKVLSSWASSIKADAWIKRSQAVKNLAVSIGILAASLVVLSQIPSTDLNKAVLSIAEITGLLAGLSVVAGVLNHFTDISGAGKEMKSMAKGILILAIALKVMENIDSETLVYNAMVLGTLASVLMVVGGSVEKMANGPLGGGKTCLAVAASVLILVQALKNLANAKGDIDGATNTMMVLMGALVAMNAAMEFTQSKFKSNVDGKTLLAMAASLYLIVMAMKKIAKMNPDEIRKGLGGVAAIMVVLAGVMLSTRLAGQNAQVAGTGILAISASLILIAQAIKMIAKMDNSDIAKGIIALGMITVLYGVLMKISKSSGDKNSAKLGVMMLGMSASILILAGAMKVIAGIDGGDIAKGVITIGFLAGIVTVLSKLSGGMKDIKIAPLLSMTVIIAALTASVAALSMIDTGKLLLATLALSALMGVFTLVERQSKNISGAGKTLAIMTGVVASMAVVLGILANIPNSDNVLSVACGLSTVLGAVTAACAITTATGVNPASAASAALGLVAFVGVLATLMTALGGVLSLVNNFTGGGVDTALDYLKTVLFKVGDAVGSLVGGFAAGATSGLPAIGSNLSGFATNAAGFFSMLSTLNPDCASAAGTLASAIGSFVGSGILDGLFEKFTGKSSLASLGTSLTQLGMALTGFYLSTLLIKDTGHMQEVVAVAQSISDLNNALPATGGKLQAWLGSKDLSLFATGASNLGDAMKSFAESTSGITDTGNLESVVKVAQGLAKLNDALPETDGIIQKITGWKDMSGFGEGIKAFGKAMSDFSSSVSGDNAINEDAVAAAKRAGELMTQLANDVPTSGGLISWFTGNNDIGGFGESLKKFGTSLSDFSGSASDIDGGQMDTVMDVTKKLVTLANSMGADNGFAAASSNLTTFAQNLMQFGTQFTTGFYSEIASVDAGKITAVSTAMQVFYDMCSKTAGQTIDTSNLVVFADTLGSKMQDLNTKLSGLTGIDTFGTTIVQFGIKLNAFGQYVNTVDTGKMNAVSTSIQKMYDTMSKCQGSFDTSGMQSYLRNMSSSMGDTMSGVSSSITSASSGATSAMSGLFDGLSSTVQTRSTSLNASFKTLGSSMIKSFASAITAGRGLVASAASNVASAGLPAAKAHYGGYYSAGVYLCAGLAGGIGAGASSAINAASNVAAQALAAAKARLGIHSPSREFYAVGDFAVQGLTNALNDGQKSAQSAGSNIATASLAGLQNSLDMISALMSSGLDTSPTITPVLDDSQVRAGIQRVNTMMTNLTVGQNMAMAGASFGINQNGDTSDVVSAINGLRKDILERPQNVYTVNGVTYDDGSTTANAVKTLVRAVKMNGRA